MILFDEATGIPTNTGWIVEGIIVFILAEIIYSILIDKENFKVSVYYNDNHWSVVKLVSILRGIMFSAPILIIIYFITQIKITWLEIWDGIKEFLSFISPLLIVILILIAYFWINYEWGMWLADWKLGHIYPHRKKKRRKWRKRK